MRNLHLLIFFAFITACTAPLALNPPAAEANVGVPATQPVVQVEAVASQINEGMLYISGTTHIESINKNWPNPDAFLAFLQQITSLGFRWSVGADVGWLEGEARAAEVIQKSEAMGVQWDVHAHNGADRAKAAYLITQYGGHPTSVVSGMLVTELDSVRDPLTYQGFTWTPEVLWGGTKCVAHRPGCDDTAAGLWIPLSSDQYQIHDPNGTQVRVGGGTHQLNDGIALAQSISNGQYDYPVISYTIMVDPSKLTIVNSNDGVEQITAFVQQMNQFSFVRWASIEETAQAWWEAGAVPSRIEME